MEVHLLVLVALLSFSILDYQNRNSQSFSVYKLLFCILLVCIAGFRYRVGTDYGQYAFNFWRYAEEPLPSLLDEPGIRIIARAVKILFPDFRAFMFTCSLITVALYVYTINKVTNKFWYCVALFIFIGSWTVSFNAVRQCFAGAIIFAGHRYIYDRKLLKWCLTVFIAMTFHISAVICLLFYFTNKRLSDWGIFFLVIISACSSILLESLLTARAYVTGAEISGIGVVYATRSVHFLRIVMVWIPVFLYIFLLRKKDKEDPNFSFYMNLTMINALIATLTKDSALLFRLSIYTQIFTAIAWPLIIEKFAMRYKSISYATFFIVYLIWFIIDNNITYSSKFDFIFYHELGPHYIWFTG